MKTLDKKTTVIELPYSKSLNARQLVINTIMGESLICANDCDDIRVLQNALSAIRQNIACNAITVNINHSGTALRFLTAYCAALPGTAVNLTGSAQLKSRPIQHLVDALRTIGADIQYIENEGHAPLLIHGKELAGGDITVDSSISSQYISALMLTAPLMKSALCITLTGRTVSESYITMTAETMRQHGIAVTFDNSRITVSNDRYATTGTLNNERDWSAATFWLAAAAVFPGHKIMLPGLTLASLQPDAATAGIFRHFGVICRQTGNGVELAGTGKTDGETMISCRQTPDAIPAIIVTACLTNTPIAITGAETLKYKESNRTKVLVDELTKCGYNVTFDDRTATLRNTPMPVTPTAAPLLCTHSDHRIAMSLALVAMTRNIRLDDPAVVRKSYPDFWTNYRRLRNDLSTQNTI